MKSLIWLMLSLVWLSSARAEDDGTMTVDRTGNVVVWKNTPPGVLQRLPRGSRNWFFGDCRLKKQAPVIYLHFYATPTKNNIVGNGGSDVSGYFLDFYRHPKNGRWERWRSLWTKPDQYPVDGATVKLQWLDKRQRVPVFRVTFSHAGFYGGWESHRLLIFSRGLYHQPLSQDFKSYGDHNEAYWPRFNSRDAKGNLQVVIERSFNGGDPQSLHHDIPLRWNGRKFS